MVAKIPKDGVPARNSSLTRLKLEVGSCSIALPVGWRKCFHSLPSGAWLCGAARPFDHSRHLDPRMGSSRSPLRVGSERAALRDAHSRSVEHFTVCVAQTIAG